MHGFDAGVEAIQQRVPLVAQKNQDIRVGRLRQPSAQIAPIDGLFPPEQDPLFGAGCPVS